MVSRRTDPKEAWERLVRHYLGEPLPEVERRRLAVAVREACRMPGSEGDADVAAEGVRVDALAPFAHGVAFNTPPMGEAPNLPGDADYMAERMELEPQYSLRGESEANRNRQTWQQR